jgi:Cu+-exporting ATPase
MALESEQAGADSDDSELRDMTRRFWVALVLSLPVVVIAMAEMLPGLGHLAGRSVVAWMQLVLTTPVVLWCGAPFFERGWASIRNRHANMFTLIAVGTGVAYAHSVVATLAPGSFPGCLPHRARYGAGLF